MNIELTPEQEQSLQPYYPTRRGTYKPRSDLTKSDLAWNVKRMVKHGLMSHARCLAADRGMSTHDWCNALGIRNPYPYGV